MGPAQSVERNISPSDQTEAGEKEPPGWLWAKIPDPEAPVTSSLLAT